MIVLFTGGGTAGHILPNVPLIERLAAEGHSVHYAGSGVAMERDLLAALPLTYHVLPTGKLRRYFSLQNVRDAWRVLQGIVAGVLLVRRLRPDVVFSKGGFVSVPAVLGAWLCKVPVIAHESDRSPGLANRIAHRVATRICTSFPETHFGRPDDPRVVFTGLPVRAALLAGDAARGRALLGFGEAGRRVLLVMGGSQGSAALNAFVRALLPALDEAGFDVAHLCGRGALQPALEGHAGYRQFEFLGEPLGDVLAAADVVLTRAGATTLYELFALRKPALLVPLTRAQSRGDQIENAAWARERGLAEMLEEADLTPQAALAALARLLADVPGIVARQAAAFPPRDAVAELVALITAVGARGGR